MRDCIIKHSSEHKEEEEEEEEEGKGKGEGRLFIVPDSFVLWLLLSAGLSLCSRNTLGIGGRFRDCVGMENTIFRRPRGCVLKRYVRRLGGSNSK